MRRVRTVSEVASGRANMSALEGTFACQTRYALPAASASNDVGSQLGSAMAPTTFTRFWSTQNRLAGGRRGIPYLSVMPSGAEFSELWQCQEVGFFSSLPGSRVYYISANAVDPRILGL